MLKYKTLNFTSIQKIKATVIFFMVALFVSGATAFPVLTEMRWLQANGFIKQGTTLGNWLQSVLTGAEQVNNTFPFLFYGFDWLAYAHIMIAALFYGVYKNPIQNKFIVNWAVFCCASIIPLAFICGPIRKIPMMHILIDCSFGVFGCIPLLFIKKWTKQLELAQTKLPSHWISTS